MRGYEDVLTPFLRLVIQANVSELLAQSGSGMFSSITGANLRGFSVSLPPLAVQRRIVDLMAHLDNHLANLRAEHEALGLALEVARVELTRDWAEVALGEVCSIKSSMVDPRSNEYGGMLHIGIERMGKDGGELDVLATALAEGLVSGKYLFGPNDVIFSKIRPNLRKVVWPGFAGLCSADAYPLTPALGVQPGLLREVLLHPAFSESVVMKSGRTKMPKVNRRELFECQVRMTGDLVEREQVSDILETLRFDARSVEKEFEELVSVRASALSQCLAGDISIPDSYDSLLAGVA